MARFEVLSSIDPLLRISLEPGESVAAESNAMVAMDGSISLKGETRGDFFKSLARKFLNDENFFQQSFVADDEPGSVRCLSRKISKNFQKAQADRLATMRGVFTSGNANERPTPSLARSACQGLGTDWERAYNRARGR